MPVADITIILIDYYLNTIISELFGLELLTLSVICSVPIPIVNKKIINSQHVIIIQKIATSMVDSFVMPIFTQQKM